MSFTVFLGNLPVWVTADDIKSWLTSESLVADAVKVIRNPETQESKGFAFIDAPNQEEMNAIIRRFDRAPLEDRLLRANPAQPPKGKTGAPVSRPPAPGDRYRRPTTNGTPNGAPNGSTTGAPNGTPSAQRRTAHSGRRPAGTHAGQSAFAEELLKVL